MAVQPLGGWQFVNINEPKKQKKDESIRRIVRANAMRDFRRKQKEEKHAAAQVQATSRLREARVTECPKDVVEACEAPILAKSPQCFIPEYMPGFLGDERLNDDAYNLCSLQLKELLGTLEALSLTELTMRNEEELAQQARQQVFDPSTAPEWLPVDSRELSGRDSTGRAKRGVMVDPRTLLDIGGDPFNTMPASSTSSKYNAYVLHHFVTVMATNALPFDPGVGENPLTKIWLPYAMLDTTLFLSTLTFAAVHLDILTGRRDNLKLLYHKSETIKSINEKIRSPENALSNISIGAVAMMAATEIMLGNAAELKIHMNALKNMVSLRGGLQQLGWSGVLHMFISWQDLLYSSILAQPPAYEMTPCCVMIRGNTPPHLSVHEAAGFDPQITEHFETLFADLQYLTSNLNRAQQNSDHGKEATTLDLMTFSKVRTTVEHRILAMARLSGHKPRNMMTRDEYALEICRRAALVFIKCGLHMYLPICTILVSLKEQIMQLIRDEETYCGVGTSGRREDECTVWAILISSLLAVTTEEEVFFAKRIAERTRIVGGLTWSHFEILLRRIAWLEKLRTPVCKAIWSRVERIKAEESRNIGMVDPLWQLFDGSHSGQDIYYTRETVHVRLSDRFGAQIPSQV